MPGARRCESSLQGATGGENKQPERTGPSLGRNYYVPAMFTPGHVKRLDSRASVTFFVDFKGFFTGEYYIHFMLTVKTGYFSYLYGSKIFIILHCKLKLVFA